VSRPVAILASTVLAGSAAWQAPANSRLGESIGLLPASLVSFVVSVAFLLLAAALTSGPRSVAALPGELARVPVRYLTGGLIGASYVIVAIVTVERLGTGGVIAGSVAGTLVGAVAIDWAGLLGVTRTPPGPGRIAGVLMLLAGTILLSGAGDRELDPLPIAAIFAVGVLVAFQPPVNARLAARIGGPRAALAQSSVGLGALALVAGVAVLGPGAGGSGEPIPWWALIGGVLGALYVVSTLESVPAIGAGGVAAASIAGGLAFGVAADAIGLFGLERVPLGAPIVGGLLLLAAGAMLVLRRQGPVP